MRFKEFSLFLFIGFTLTFYSCDYQKDDILTPRERQWLQDHPNVSIAVSTIFPPFQYVDEHNNTVGVSIGILELLEDKINYKFQRKHFDNWKNILDAGKQGDIDMILEIQETMDRREYFHFTKPFIRIPHVIVMRKSSSDNITIDDLEDLQIGVVDNYAVQEHLIEMYPELKLYPLPDDKTCLLALSNQKIDAFITQQGYASYEIYNNGLTNLHIVGDVGYDNVLGIAVRKDWSILTRIMDKGLSRISQKEKTAIFNRWIPIHPEPFWKKTVFWTFVSILVAGFFLVLTLIFFWNRSLRRRVEIKTHQLKKTKEKAEESNRLKSSFLANMSHEIRTPMNAIQGFSELITNNKLTQEQKLKYSRIISFNCDSLSKLIDEILDLSQIESGLISINNQKFNPINCIEEVINTNKVTIPNDKNIQLQFSNLLKQDSFEINTDSFRFRQILHNLINNAIKFSKQGNITITVNYKNANELLFCVKDEGIGIDEASIPLIFDRFIKIEKDSSILYRGSGLGLNICKKLLELMNGEIWVKSKMGVGSSFYFTLPIN